MTESRHSHNKSLVGVYKGEMKKKGCIHETKKERMMRKRCLSIWEHALASYPEYALRWLIKENELSVTIMVNVYISSLCIFAFERTFVSKVWEYFTSKPHRNISLILFGEWVSWKIRVCPWDGSSLASGQIDCNSGAWVIIWDDECNLGTRSHS